MTVLGGSGAAHPGAIATMLSGLQLPEEAAIAQSVNQVLGPAQGPERAIPAVALELPNISQARADAEAVQGIELPTFGEEPENDQNYQSDALVDSPAAALEDDEADLPDTPAAENFKKLRTVVKTERQAKRELEARLMEASGKLERYERGEVVPDIIRAKDERIAQLEPYEKIVSLKLSPEYQENFVAPAIELKGELEKLGEDYGLPKELMHQAVGITNRKDLNSFLSRHFDDVGGLEVKRVIGELQDLGERALEADKAPGEALQSLKAQFKERQDQERQERASVFEVTAKDAWNAALEKTKKEGVYKELILHPTDSEWNKKVVEPIQHRASTQYGALIKQLSDNGLKTLPPALAAGLARQTQLAVAGAMALDAKDKAEKERNAVIQNTKRTAGYMRPSIGGQNGSAHNTRAATSTGPVSPKSAAEEAVKVFK